MNIIYDILFLSVIMKDSLVDKVVIITGASFGIGRALAIEMAKRTRRCFMFWFLSPYITGYNYELFSRLIKKQWINEKEWFSTINQKTTFKFFFVKMVLTKYFFQRLTFKVSILWCRKEKYYKNECVCLVPPMISV